MYFVLKDNPAEAKMKIRDKVILRAKDRQIEFPGTTKELTGTSGDNEEFAKNY